MRVIKIAKEKYYCPTGWHEVSAQKAMALSPMLIVRPEDKFYLRLAALQVLSGIPFMYFRLMSAEALRDLCDLISWIDQPLLKPIRTKIRIGFTNYYSPAENMTNMSAVEYQFCDFKLTKLGQAKNPEQIIDLIISALYRPHGSGFTSTDYREAFDMERVKANARHISKMKPEDKVIILTWFICCHQAMYKRYKVIFDKTGSETESSKESNSGLMGLFFTIAETGIFGTFEQVLNTNIHTLFTYWAKKVIASKVTTS
jgi:hypothetical protein